MIIWCMVLEIWSAKDRIFCHFRPFFALFPYNKKNQNFGKKKKKTPGDIIILQKCTKNYNHINGSWDTEKKMAGVHNRHNFLSFWTIFCSLAPLTPHKIKILEKRKNNLADIIILNMWHMVYGSWYGVQQNFLSLWIVFCTFTPLTT